jgi:hypothetical protein
MNVRLPATHEPDCLYSSGEFRHPLACLCMGSKLRKLASTAHTTSYDPDPDDMLAEERVERALQEAGARTLSTAKLLARFANPALSNAWAGDILAIWPDGKTESYEVKRMTAAGRLSGRLVIGNWAIKDGQADRLAVANPDGVVWVCSWSDIRRDLMCYLLESYTDSKSWVRWERYARLPLTSSP